jgi:nucleotide-binding universal stress UspA family protein
MRNILVGYDGSEAAVHALAFAAGLARAFGSPIERYVGAPHGSG